MRALLDLCLPSDCAGCGARGEALCASCRSRFAATPPHPAWPQPSPRGLPLPYAVLDNDGPARAVLLAYKEQGVSALRAPLAAVLLRALAAAWLQAGPGCAVVPVPTSAAARRSRGADVVGDLGRSAVAGLRRHGLAADWRPVLRHRRAVADSARLTAAQRAANLEAAFVVAPARVPAVRGRTVVLVDDLITTGTTLAECAAALRSAGAEVRAAATVAATQRR
jgi:predicted amidophosphoribosyltransferase